MFGLTNSKYTTYHIVLNPTIFFYLRKSNISAPVPKNPGNRNCTGCAVDDGWHHLQESCPSHSCPVWHSGPERTIRLLLAMSHLSRRVFTSVSGTLLITTQWEKYQHPHSRSGLYRQCHWSNWRLAYQDSKITDSRWWLHEPKRVHACPRALWLRWQNRQTFS